MILFSFLSSNIITYGKWEVCWSRHSFIKCRVIYVMNYWWLSINYSAFKFQTCKHTRAHTGAHMHVIRVDVWNSGRTSQQSCGAWENPWHHIWHYLLTRFPTVQADLMTTKTVLTRNYARCYEGSKDKSDRSLRSYKTQNPSRTADMCVINQNKAWQMLY